jgi:dTMP kinase
MNKGLFIVLEGVDGSGTTSQGRHLANSLYHRGVAVHLTAEPSQGPVGVLLRQILKGRVVVPHAQGSRMPSWSTMALLFAADRLDHLEAEVEPLLQKGISVICDRYYHSSLAYQSATSSRPAEVIEWIRQTNAHARQPDLTIVLDVSFEIARERRRFRNDQEVYENDTLQRKLCDIYKNIEQYAANEPIVHVNADLPFDRVAQALLERVLPLFE